jgi:hypothetical protein
MPEIENPVSEVSEVSEVSPAPITPERPKYKPAVLAALREFRHSRPWRGTVEERKVKFQTLHAALCLIYEREVELHFDVDEPETPVGNGWAAGDRTQIGLVGKLSVVTFLHEWAHVLFGPSEARAFEWSVNLYQRIFRRSAARMVRRGNFILRPETAMPVPWEVTGMAPPESSDAVNDARAIDLEATRAPAPAECPDDVGENV